SPPVETANRRTRSRGKALLFAGRHTSLGRKLILPMPRAFDYHPALTETGSLPVHGCPSVQRKDARVTATIRQLAELVHGQVHGDADLPITAARPLGEAQAGDITFVESARHAHQLPQSHASAAVVAESFPVNGKTLIRVTDPLTAFIAIVRHFHTRPDEVV